MAAVYEPLQQNETLTSCSPFNLRVEIGYTSVPNTYQSARNRKVRVARPARTRTRADSLVRRGAQFQSSSNTRYLPVGGAFDWADKVCARTTLYHHSGHGVC